MEIITQLKSWMDEFPYIKDILMAGFILITAYLSYYITNRVVIRLFSAFARRSKTKIDDAIVESKVLQRLAYLVPVIVLQTLVFLVPYAEKIILATCNILVVFIFMLTLSAFLNAINRYYETLPVSKERPIKGFVQVGIIIVYITGGITILGLLTGQSPWVLLSGIGAMTAVLLLIFKDTILSFVAGIEITGYDLLHVGDWIEVPEYGADGDVIDIALHTVKVQNWDKTITVIPTHKLTSNPFKNWRGMQETGGRRIKRAVHIDQNSIKFCDEQMIERFKKIQILQEYIIRKEKELEEYNRKYGIDDRVPVNGRRMTNIGTFRAYTQEYLKRHPKLRTDLTMMVRQLPPGPQGLPIEIYAFSKDIAWENYETIQADIFDHLLSIVPHFDLRLFQNPSGHDFQMMRT